MRLTVTFKKIGRKVLKVLAWIITSFIVLLLILILAVRVPYVQNKITHAAVGFLEKKIGTPVHLDYIQLNFPKKIVLKGLYVEDQARDTLLYAGWLGVDTDLWALLSHSIVLNKVELENITAHVYRVPNDSAFNFTYIINAFTADSSVAKDTTQTEPWKFDLHHVSIQHANVIFNDPLAGNELNLKLGELDSHIEEFDLERSRIAVDDIIVHAVDGVFTQSKLSPSSTESTPFAYTLGVNEIDLTHINVRYEQQALGQIITVKLDEAMLKTKAIDIAKRKVLLDKFMLDHALISYQQLAGYIQKADSIPAHVQTVNAQPWQLALGNLSVNNTSLQYYDFNKSYVQKGIDYSHLWITSFNMDAEALKSNGMTAEGKLNALSLMDRSGFAVQSFTTRFTINNKRADLDDFALYTDKTRIRLDAHARFNSLATLANDYAKAHVDLDIKDSEIALRDILNFSPSLFDSIPLRTKNVIVALRAKANGTLADLAVPLLTINTLHKTELHLHGRVQGLPAINNTRFTLALEKFYTTRADIDFILVDSVKPKSIMLPEWLSLQGNFKGSFKNPNVVVRIKSDVGAIDLKGAIALDSRSAIDQQYNGDIQVDAVDVGKILKMQPTLGKVSLNAHVKGKGFTMETIDTEADVMIRALHFQGYDYRNLKINTLLKKNNFTGDVSLHDKNIDFTLKGGMDRTTLVPTYTLTGDIRNVDLKGLHLSARPLKVRGIMSGKVTTNDFKIMNGRFTIRDVDIYNGEKLYAADSFLTATVTMDSITRISLHSDLVNADFKGTMNLTELPQTFSHYVARYFATVSPKKRKAIESEQHFQFAITLKNSELLHDIILPDLKTFMPGPITGTFNSREHTLDIKMLMGQIRYATTATDSIRIMIHADAERLHYGVMLKDVRYDTLRVRQFDWEGSVAHDTIHTRIAILDSLQQKKYQVAGTFTSEKNAFRFHFNDGQLILNYNNWSAPKDNALQFGNGMEAHSLSISSNHQRIGLATRNDKDSTLAITFENVDLANLSNIVTEKSNLIQGRLNGEFLLLRAKHGAFKGNVKLSSLQLFDKPWGNLMLEVSRASADVFDVDLSIQGDNAEITGKGSYTVKQERAVMNLQTNIGRLNLTLLEPFTGGQLSHMKGDMTGRLAINGSPAKPSITGNLNFKQASFTSTYVNSAFTLKDETLNIDAAGIHFNNFEILDSQNNTAQLKGDVLTDDYRVYKFDFRLVTRKFQLLNTTRNENDLYYGKVWVNATAKIKGTSDLPVLDVEVGLSDDSELTYVVPQSDKGVLEQKGIVVFVDKNAKNDPFLATINPRDTVTNSFMGIDLTANIELTDKEKFNVIIDPITGDKLSVQGNSTLTFKLDHLGNTELSGRYEVSKGTYSLSFLKLVKRDFEIQKGGTLVWSGDPLNAILTLQALYRVETSPYELVSNQIAASAQEQYRQRLPFLVYLNINGELLKPEISFKLDMPQDKRNAFGGGVYAKISDINSRESELNKQVFSLLVLKRFMADNPFDTQSSPLSSTARNSVSKLLTEQLNRLSENVKGVTLNFDVKSYDDYTSGQAEGQTKLQLGVSKNLFNDRLVVKLSGNVDIEGQNSSQNSLTDYIGDLALEYKLTKDGRLRVTGFRSSDYDMIDGELIKTGTGLIYIKDYDTFKELFKANKEEKN